LFGDDSIARKTPIRHRPKGKFDLKVETINKESAGSGAGPVFEKWRHHGREFRIAIETCGEGPVILFLPALSTVSTRKEWSKVASALSDQFRVCLLDWPGFGDSSRPSVRYSAALLDEFLRELVPRFFKDAVHVAAAGHAAGFVLRTHNAYPRLWKRVALVAPTWRGPMLTAMGEHRRIYAGVRAAIRIPLIGPFLYYFNTSSTFLRWMYRRHVFGSTHFLTDSFLESKQSCARQRGGRFAASAFITGALDPFSSRTECLQTLRSNSQPVLIATGEQSPQKSYAEMAAMIKATDNPSLSLPGALAPHEEHPDRLVGPLRDFFR